MRTPYTVFPNAALLTICILLLCCSLPTASYKFSSLSRRFLSLPTSHRTFTSHSYSDAPCWRDTLGRETQTAGPASPFFFRKSYLPLNIVTRVRGGASVSASSTSPQRTRDTTVGDITIFLTSNFGLSPFLQKTQKIKIPRNASVAKLKEIIQEKFPGHPPIGLQNLYLESKILRSDKILGHLTNKIVLPIQLDLMSGTMMYNRTFALSKAIDAYISLEVHEAYLNNKLTEVIISPSSSQSKISNSMRHMLPDSFKYRQLYKKLNESFYETYASDIKAAFEAEKDPSIEAEDTRRWQSATIPATVANKWGASTIKDIIRHELLLNDKSVAKLTYWSSALMLYGLFGAETGASQGLSLLAIPLLWLTNVRSARLFFKLLRNVVLAVFSSVDILLRLLPAPLQVIASESRRWRTDPITVASDDIIGDSDDSDESGLKSLVYSQWIQRSVKRMLHFANRVLNFVGDGSGVVNDTYFEDEDLTDEDDFL